MSLYSGRTVTDAMRPHALYGSISEAIALNEACTVPSAITATNKENTLHRNAFFAGSQWNRLRLFLFSPTLPLNQVNISWVIPSGQIIEQYIRPNIRVTMTSPTTIARFSDSKAGISCIFAAHPNVGASPVKSTNKNVNISNMIIASVTRIVFSIVR